jgi:cytochrome c553
MKLYPLREFWGIHRFWPLVFIVLIFLPITALAQEIAGSGDFEAGKKLFTGERALANGGPACISCHNAGVTPLGGGTIGPDLSKVWVDKSFLINAAWINSGGVPIMGPIYLASKITDEEVEDLKAFFSVQAEKAVKAAARPNSLKFIGGGIAGFVSIMIVFSIIWSGRLRSRNKGTAHDDLWRNYAGKGGGR